MRNHGVLTQRRSIGACFGVASRLLTPAGQKLRFCLIPLRALGGFHGLAQSSMVWASRWLTFFHP